MSTASASASPSPKSPEVSEKSKRYDRQLRLWGDHGQTMLENSNICLINANATGTEIMKSLVLPGIGNFTIVDGNKVTEEDIGNNFFLEADSLGRSRSECATRLLNEMNPDVSGTSIEENPSTLLAHNPSFFTNFSVVIASQLNEKTLSQLSGILWEAKVPFIYCQVVGLLGWVRVQLVEHLIIESHPDNITDDLRLENPFDELREAMNSIELNGRDESVSTPWLVVMYKGLEKYVAEHHLSHPSHNPAKKQEFKTFLRKYLEDLGLHDGDDTFEEAIKATNRAFPLAANAIPSSIRAILDDPAIKKPENKFWLMCAGLKEFIEETGNFPLSGRLPDMTANSTKFISLQNVYRDRANKDAEDVFNRCQLMIEKEARLAKISLTPNNVKLFCKEAKNLMLIRGEELAKELNSAPSAILPQLAQNTEECEQNEIAYVMMRAILRFETEYNTYPGMNDQHVESDIALFKGSVNKLLNEWNSNLAVDEVFIHVICRYGAAEVHSVAAFIGGCVAQEVIKIVTAQYVPLSDTLIYNAINSTTTEMKAIVPAQ